MESTIEIIDRALKRNEVCVSSTTFFNESSIND